MLLNMKRAPLLFVLATVFVGIGAWVVFDSIKPPTRARAGSKSTAATAAKKTSASTAPASLRADWDSLAPAIPAAEAQAADPNPTSASPPNDSSEERKVERKRLRYSPFLTRTK